MECCSFHFFHCRGTLVFFFSLKVKSVPFLHASHEFNQMLNSDTSSHPFRPSSAGFCTFLGAPEWQENSRCLFCQDQKQLYYATVITYLSNVVFPSSALLLEINSSSLGTRNFSFNLMPNFISISYYTSVFLSLKSSGFTENAFARPSKLSSYLFLPNLALPGP